MKEDRELLREYIERHSEQAFTELVARHASLVYSTALRIVGDPQMAQDVCQTTFVSLARKAGFLRERDALGGWLYRTAHNAAANLLRAEQHRRRREAEAMNQAELNSDPHSAWEAIRPLLEAAMQHLKPVEQDALILRYFEGQSLRQAGQTLAVSEDAVQKRVSRALDKLRAHFARKGVVVSVAVLAAALSSHAVQAVPAGLAVSLASSSLAGAGSGSASALASILKLIVMTKVQAATLGLLFVAGVATPLTIGNSAHRSRPLPSAGENLAAGATDSGLAAASLNVAAPANAPADSSAFVRLRNWLEWADQSRLRSDEDEIRRLVRALAPGDFPRAWALRTGLKSRNLRASFGNVLMNYWGAKDGPAAVAAAVAVPDKEEQQGFLDEAISGWARKSPLEAVAWVKSFYPEAEQAWKLMGIAYSVQPLAAYTLWQQLPPGRLRDEVTSTFMDALAAQDLSAAVACLKDIQSSNKRKVARNSILNHWARKDAAAALAWAQNQPRLQDRDEATAAVISGVALHNPAQAAELLKSLSPTVLERDRGPVSEFIKRWAGSDINATASWVRQLPEGPLRDRALDSLILSWVEMKPQEAAAFAQGLPDSPAQAKLLGRVAMEWSNRDSKAALGWLEALPEGPARNAALVGFAHGLAAYKPEQAARFVADLPPGDVQTEAALKVATCWALADPPSAAAWAAAFPAGQLRERAVTGVINEWGNWNRQAAEAWLQESSLPAEIKSKLLHK